MLGQNLDEGVPEIPVPRPGTLGDELPKIKTSDLLRKVTDGSTVRGNSLGIEAGQSDPHHDKQRRQRPPIRAQQHGRKRADYSDDDKQDTEDTQSRGSTAW